MKRDGAAPRVQRFLGTAAMGLAMCVLAAIAVSSLFVTARLYSSGRRSEDIAFLRDALLPNLALTLGLLAVLVLAYRLLVRCARRRLTAGLCALWLALTLILVLGTNLGQMYDLAYVCEAAQLFAQGNYKAMQVDYFNAYSYQLGFCLPMEMLLRLLPGIDLNRFMQALNAVLSLATAGALSALCGQLFPESGAPRAALLLFVTFLPAMFYCMLVYSTLPMMLLASLSMLCFVHLLRTGKARYGVLYALLIAAAYMVKLNAAVPLLAMGIAAVLAAMEGGDWRLPAFAVLSAAAAVLLSRCAILQYELRSGITLREDVSALARLAMALQEGGASAGWFNGFTEQFFTPEVTAEQERAAAAAALSQRLAQMRADLPMTAAFFRDKLLSQWQEPAYGTLWYGNLCEGTGALAGAAQALFAQDGALRAALERMMNIGQQALYVLACIGMAGALRRRRDAAQMILPLTILGGFLYHMIFEAKSQYIYVYALYMIPLAAQGLCALSEGVSRLSRAERTRR